MARFLTSIWKRETFLLDCEDLRDLVRCQWNINPKLWIIYRILASFYLVLVLVWAFIVKYNKYQWKFFTYLSHWGYVIFVISFLFRLIATMRYYRWIEKKTEEEVSLLTRSPSWIYQKGGGRAPWLLHLSWLLGTISNPLAINITYGYWKDITTVTPVSEALNFQIHGVNAIFVCFDALVAATPTYFLHFYQPVMFYLLYVMYTAFYKVAGGTDKNGNTWIYSNMDWDYPEDLAIGVLYNIGFIILFHLGFCLLSIITSFIATKFKRETGIESL